MIGFAAQIARRGGVCFSGYFGSPMAMGLPQPGRVTGYLVGFPVRIGQCNSDKEACPFVSLLLRLV